MKFEGVFPAHVTPFKGNEINFDALRHLIDFLVDEGGVDGLVTAGCTGEAATLSFDEHKKLLEKVVEMAQNRVPVIAGTGSNSTTEAIKLTKHAEEVGADAAMLITPYYNKPQQRGMVFHYKKVARETDLPIVLYNVPSRTSIDLEPVTVAELSKIDNIVALKEANGVNQASEVKERCGTDFKVLSGNDNDTVPMISLGATGVVSVAANIVPGKVGEMVDEALNGNFEEARKIHQRLSTLFRALFLEANPVPVKKALNLSGLDVGDPRPPLMPLPEEKEEKLVKALEKTI